MMYSFNLSISRAAFRLCGTLESVHLPCSNTIVCESVFENFRQLKSLRTDSDFHCLWIWCLQKRYPWILHSAFRLDFISCYLCAFRGVRYGTCSVVQSLFTMNDTSMIYSGLSPLDLTNEHKIFKNTPNIKILTDIDREKAMGLVRGSTKANVTIWTMSNALHNGSRIAGKNRNLGEGTFLRSFHITCLDRDVRISMFDYNQKQNILRRLAGNGSAYEDPSTYVYVFQIGNGVHGCTIEELREANPDRFQQRHQYEAFATDSKENISGEQALGLWRGVTKLQLWYSGKWYLCTFLKRSYIRWNDNYTRRWNQSRDPYLYRFHWHKDPPSTYTNGPLCQLRAWNPTRLLPDGTFSENPKEEEKEEEEEEEEDNNDSFDDELNSIFASHSDDDTDN